MNTDLVELLRDPQSNRALALDPQTSEGGRIRAGRLTSDRGGIPVREFIARFVDSESYAASFGYEWTQFNKTQLDSHTGTTISRDRWTTITTKRPEEMQGKVVVEAGSGSGRFLEVVAPYARKAIGVDLSVAVEAARDNLIHRFPNVDIVQADLTKMPLKDNSVDFIYSIGVLHHIPDTLEGLRSLVRCLKPKGEMAVWLYGPRGILAYSAMAEVYRYIGSRMSPRMLLAVLKRYVPIALRLHKFPVVGRYTKALFPAPSYPNIPIPDGMRVEWSILDAYDKFATRIEQHFTEEELRELLAKAGLVNIRRGGVYNAFIGTKP